MRSKAALFALFVSTVLSINMLLDRAGAEGALIVTPTTRFEVDLGDVEVPAELSISPDGSLLVFASQTPGGVRQLYLRGSADLEVRPIPGTENASEPEFSPDGNWIAFVANGTDLKRIPARGGIPLAITTLLPILSAPSWGPDESILFVGKDGLYQIPVEGGDPVQILATSLYASRLPRYVPGANIVLFTHQLTDSTDPEVNFLDLESGEVTFLAPGRDARYLDSGHLIFATPSGSMVARPFDPARGEFSGSSIPLLDDVAISRVSGERLHFTVAQSGTAVYAVGSSNQLAETLVQVDLVGNKTAIPGIGTGNFSAPRFDPTGRYLAFEFDGAVWIRDLLLGRQDQLHDVPAYNPIWSTDGSMLAFGHGPLANGVTQILTRRSDLSSPPELLLESKDFMAPSAWTPDDSQLVFTEFVGQDATGAEIWTVNTDAPGIPEAYLRADGWDEGFVSLSPDGRWAAYESEEGGADAIYVMSFPEPTGRIRVSESGGLGARWSRDGRRIFYRNGDTTKVVNVRLQPTFEVLSHETLFVGPFGGISPHPDGTRFVAIERPGTAVGGANRHLYFVVNWLDEALTRLAASR